MADAHVEVRTGADGDPQLVAYVVLDEGARWQGASALREAMLGRLPAHMVPQQWVRLEAMPLTAHGKLDRRALPAPSGAGDGERSADGAPLTATQELLCAVWAKLLGHSEVGLDDNFFDLGGDSIRVLGVQRAARAHGCAFSVEQLYRHPSVRRLAHHLETPVDNEPDEADLPEAALQDGPADVEAVYPLTKLQQGMVFHAEREREAAAYRDVFALCFPGVFNRVDFERALETCVLSHPALRTVFRLHAHPEPLQWVLRTAPLPLVVEDATDAADDAAWLNALIEDDKRIPFDVEAAPLWRMRVQVREGDAFALVLCFHHAILDGWSVASFLSELITAYHDRTPSPATAANGVGVMHRYVLLERAMLRSDAAAEWWKARMDAMPTARLSARQVANGALQRATIHFEPLLVDRLRKRASSAGLPLRVMLLAAHGEVLKAITGQRSVSTAAVHHGRPEVERAERALGLFLNVLPYEASTVTGDWIETAEALFAQERDAMAYRRYPVLQAWAQGGQPMPFDTIFNFTHFHVYDAVRARSALMPRAVDVFEQTNFGLVAGFSTDPIDGGLRLTLSCAIPGWSLPRLEMALALYRQAIDQIADAPRQRPRVGQLDSAARAACVEAARAVRSRQSLPRSVLAQVVAQADRNGGAPAVIDHRRTWSYADLVDGAAQLAVRLRAQGVRPESVVGVMLPRGGDLFAASLGVWYAGAAYLTLDPELPPARLKAMADDACCACIVTDEPWLDFWQGTTVVPVESVRAPRLPRLAQPDLDDASLAYVIFTSGSSGAPKGVQITQEGLSELVEWHIDRFALGAATRSSHVAGLGFDAAVWELWPTLCAGGTVYPVDDALRLDVPAWRSWLTDHRITLCFAPTVLCEQLLSEPWDATASLRYLLTGGEALRQRPRAGMPFRLFNQYGPTEATVVATSTEVEASSVDEGTIPIGRPLPGTVAHVLDERLEPVSKGVVGELYLGGRGVARGYLGKAGLTAERFVPDPFEAGQRLYRTGDLVRSRWDGQRVHRAGGSADQVARAPDRG
ncbi:amino acid adenylation domain-containing protein [Burkholderia sp. FERM BP-3421]|uniref:amino acid adenylation domain-containing protein n=1 Tax=Burkholderia sp. FERM BP-3421 TaxID=1494466 RepID=UPI002360FFE4|nr:amino acid adenylation domain-containing protein [Burkholderia sp. FERM BP-3421]WDD92416.1 amino acid adenylation domain-containing protein [Burkholderia sp. FERM BP-3421]